MSYLLLKVLADIGDIATEVYRFCIRKYDHCKGEKVLRIISISDDANEAYTLHTTTGGTIRLFCAERIYELTYSSWWCFAVQHHKSYKVYGVCEGDIPVKLKSLIEHGLTIGAMLPNILSSEEQKKEAIHVYASLLVTELEKDTKK